MLREADGSDDQTDIVTTEDDALYCRACGHLVTRTRWRVAIDGRREHLFVNPAGIAFEIACYREAPGAADASPATLEATWFPGFAWRVSICAGCSRHLGWRFEAVDAAQVFFGLIANRLTNQPRD